MRVKVFLPAVLFGGDLLDPNLDTSGWVGTPVSMGATRVGEIVRVEGVLR